MPRARLGETANAPGPALYADAAFRAGFARLAAHGLSFDAWLYHPQLDELTALAPAASRLKAFQPTA